MGRHLIAFGASVNPSSLTKMAPVADGTLTIAQNTVLLPAGLTNLVGVYGGCPGGTSPGFTRYQVVTPSLKNNSVPIEIDQVDTTSTNPNDTIVDRNGAIQMFDDAPVPLVAGEGLEVDVLTAGGTAGQVTVLCWLDDLNNIPVTGRPICGVRATSSTTLTANTWTSCSITFDNTLPAGTYAIIGMHAESATGYAARIIISGTWRMGVVPCLDTKGTRPGQFRMGRMGNPAPGTYYSWGAFVNTTPPNIEFLAYAADTSETVLFDLIKIA